MSQIRTEFSLAGVQFSRFSRLGFSRSASYLSFGGVVVNDTAIAQAG
jgi:hypothetical protein